MGYPFVYNGMASELYDASLVFIDEDYQIDLLVQKRPLLMILLLEMHRKYILILRKNKS